MSAVDKKSLPKCWSQRLWWVFLLLSLLVAYLVLRNFEMGYWTFLLFLAMFVAAGTAGGHYLGVYIDRNHRSEKGLFRQERRLCRSLHKWMHSVNRRKGDKLAGPIQRKLEDRIKRLGELVENEEDRTYLHEERIRIEQFIDEHLGKFKKSPTREYIESIGVAVLIALFLRAFVIEAFQIPSQSMVPTLRVGDHIFVNKLSYGIRIPLLPLKIFGGKIPAVAWNWSIPDRGDVIVFITPENEEEDYIKRVVAVAGDEVAVRSGQLYLNGEPAPLENGEKFEYRSLDDDGEFLGMLPTKLFQERLGERNHPILRKACTMSSQCHGLGPTECDAETGLCIQGDFGPETVPEDHVFVMGDNRDNSRDSRYWGTVPLELIKGRAVFIWWSFRESLVRWERMFTKIN
jgi:signal peptidase I